MRNYDVLTQRLLERRKGYLAEQKKKKKSIIRIAIPGCCFVLVVSIVLAMWQTGVFRTGKPQGVVGVSSLLNSQLASSLFVSQESSKWESSPQEISSASQQSQPQSQPQNQSNINESKKEDSETKLEAQAGQVQTNSSLGSIPQWKIPSFCLERPKPMEFPSMEESDENVSGDAPGDIAGDAIPPFRFANVEGFTAWLQTGGEEEAKRQYMLNANSPTLTKTYYYRPRLRNGKNGWQLTNINVNYENVYYNYAMNGDIEQTNLGIYVGVTDLPYILDNMNLCNRLIDGPDKEFRTFTHYGSATRDVTYAYYYFPRENLTTIYWTVNNIPFYAVYDGDYSEIEQILPFLKMEIWKYKVSQ